MKNRFSKRSHFKHYFVAQNNHINPLWASHAKVFNSNKSLKLHGYKPSFKLVPAGFFTRKTSKTTGTLWFHTMGKFPQASSTESHGQLSFFFATSVGKHKPTRQGFRTRKLNWLGGYWDIFMPILALYTSHLYINPFASLSKCPRVPKPQPLL